MPTEHYLFHVHILVVTLETRVKFVRSKPSVVCYRPILRGDFDVILTCYLSLLSIAGKILAKILLNRLNVHLDKAGLIQESQCGFRKDRGTIDMIFTARQLQEKCQEQNLDLYMTFVDLTKAFDTVSRDGLWKIMAKFGCPP